MCRICGLCWILTTGVWSCDITKIATAVSNPDTGGGEWGGGDNMANSTEDQQISLGLESDNSFFSIECCGINLSTLEEAVQEPTTW